MRVNTNGLMGTHSQLGILTNMDSVDHIEAVSYTHLDVYKRQVEVTLLGVAVTVAVTFVLWKKNML